MANASLADHKYYVYVHSRLSSGEPFYIGKGKDKRAFSSNKRNIYWKRIVAKDGGFHVSFVKKELDEEMAFLMEIEVIDKLRLIKANLTNATNGGEGSSGHKCTEEQRLKLAERMKGNKYRQGKTFSQETIQKIKSWVITPEIRLKMSIAQKNRPKRIFKDTQRAALLASHLGVPSPLRGVEMPEETKAKLRVAWEKRRLTPVSAETRLKKSISLKGRVVSNETRLKLSNSKKGKKLSHESLQRRRQSILEKRTS